jgi:para-nitrobenzyl esterase
MTVVQIENGKVRGHRHEVGYTFKGIPYAADTGGRHRFQAPRRVPDWPGVRDALIQGDRCPQKVEALPKTRVFSWYGEETAFSENCCVLNIFTPDLPPTARRPVMFYIHGGGYASGGSGGPCLDGSKLSAFGDVVVVTVNHRLNLFGYMNLSNLDSARFADAANAGHLDLIAALQWVKRNISEFGGDPGNVTLFGQSGGGNKVIGLLAMPAANGLFRRAIDMSGPSGMHLVRPDQTHPYVEAMLAELGIAGSELHQLQELPINALQTARNRAMSAVKYDGAQPVVDGRHILASPFTTEGLALHASVPLMLGTTETEATFHLGKDTRNFGIDYEQLRTRVQAHFGMDKGGAEDLIAAYCQNHPGQTAFEILSYLGTDVLARGPMILAAEAKAALGQAPVYLYNFTWKISEDEGIWRSPHTVDIPFAFGTVDSARSMTGPGPGPMKVARNMMSAFIAFARTGHPNNVHMPTWRCYDSVMRATMVIDEECRLVNDFHGADRIASAPLLGSAPTTVLRGPLFRGVD